MDGSADQQNGEGVVETASSQDEQLSSTDTVVETSPQEEEVACSSSSSLLPSSDSGLAAGTVTTSEDNNVNVTASLEEDEETIDWETFQEILKDEEEQDEDLDAVLGGSDDKNCTYLLDEVGRQPLYACKTCEMKVNPATGEKYLAGFCLACSYHCHDQHELVELYTKRNFRCDCGTDKFASNGCKLIGKCGIINEENKYNHNFAGNYCTCDRPYPDLEDHVEDCMLQCGLCEDWFHGRHLPGVTITETSHTEMVCFQCVKKCVFLIYYNEDGCFEEDETEESNPLATLDILVENQTESRDSGIVASASQCESSNEAAPVVPRSVEPDEVGCKLAKLKQKYIEKYQSETIAEEQYKTLLLGSKWRLALCKCPACLEMYQQLEVEFITSQEDMVYSYEQKSKKKANEEKEKKITKELGKLPHVQKVEFASAVVDFKTELQKFFQDISQKKRVITKEDVEDFFETMRSRKRQRTDSIPFHCGTSGR